MNDLPEEVEPSWLAIAESQIGTEEFPGSESNPAITKYFRATGLGGHPDDSVPWCSAFVNWVMEQAGYRGTRRANARSWVDWGARIPGPKRGAIAVLWRGHPESKQGHVGFVVDTAPYRVILLGGNQGNRVGRQEYSSGRVLTYLWPRAIDLLKPNSAS